VGSVTFRASDLIGSFWTHEKREGRRRRKEEPDIKKGNLLWSVRKAAEAADVCGVIRGGDRCKNEVLNLSTKDQRAKL
jgi:hypothetical protein